MCTEICLCNSTQHMSLLAVYQERECVYQECEIMHHGPLSVCCVCEIMHHGPLAVCLLCVCEIMHHGPLSVCMSCV